MINLAQYKKTIFVIKSFKNFTSQFYQGLIDTQIIVKLHQNRLNNLLVIINITKAIYNY